MQGPIAVLGWGSLLWDLEVLTPNVRQPWQMNAGPALPIEFSRISPKRKRSLVLCIDLSFGRDCATHAIPSIRQTMAEARQDLAARERAPEHFIGAVCLGTGTQHGRAEIARIVGQWCEETGHAGAVWTDLHSNYTDELARDFTIEGGIAYLRTLDAEGLDEAVRYIEFAPAATDTPLRRALARDPWWQDQKVRVLGGAG